MVCSASGAAYLHQSLFKTVYALLTGWGNIVMQDFKVDFYHALETATSAAKEAASILNIYAQDHSK
ncbi:hypothetical protein QP445_16835, partial [Micrococcus luteus]|nr:hypothetical protein [Micrococcus luteus]